MSVVAVVGFFINFQLIISLIYYQLRDEIIEHYEKGQTIPGVGALCEYDLELLRKWRWDPNMTKEVGYFLTVQGWNDLKILAIRLNRAFPHIAEGTYDPKKFIFQHSTTQRTEASYKAFLEGLFGENAYQHVNSTYPAKNDALIRVSHISFLHSSS